jgi:hypothetical protein
MRSRAAALLPVAAVALTPSKEEVAEGVVAGMTLGMVLSPLTALSVISAIKI